MVRPIALALMAFFSTSALAASILGTARNESGTVIEFGDGLFPQQCGEQNTAIITSPDGTRTLACYVDNGHVITVTPILENSNGAMVLGALAGSPRSRLRRGPSFTLPSSAVSWSAPQNSGWITP